MAAAAAAAAARLAAAASAPAVRGASTTTAHAGASAGGAAAKRMFKDLTRAPTTTTTAGAGSGPAAGKLGALSGATALRSGGISTAEAGAGGATAVARMTSRKGGAGAVAHKLPKGSVLLVGNTTTTTAVKRTTGSRGTKIDRSGRSKNGGGSGNAMGTAAKADTNTAGAAAGSGNAVGTDGVLVRNVAGGPAVPPPTCCRGLQQVREEARSESQRISDHHAILEKEDTLIRGEISELILELKNNKAIAKAGVSQVGYIIIFSGVAFLGALTSALGPLIKNAWKADTITAMENKVLKTKAAEEAAASSSPATAPLAATSSPAA